MAKRAAKLFRLPIPLDALIVLVLLLGCLGFGVKIFIYDAYLQSQARRQVELKLKVRLGALDNMAKKAAYESLAVGAVSVVGRERWVVLTGEANKTCMTKFGGVLHAEAVDGPVVDVRYEAAVDRNAGTSCRSGVRFKVTREEFYRQNSFFLGVRTRCPDVKLDDRSSRDAFVCLRYPVNLPSRKKT